MFTTAYVINLDRDVLRWKSVSQEIRRVFPDEIAIVRVAAADGSNAETRKDPDWEAVGSGLCKWLCTPSQIGCALSHLKVWKTFLATDEPTAMICEDDVVFKQGNTYALLEQAESQIPEDFDLLYLGCNECDYDTSKHTWWGTFLHTMANGGKSVQKQISENIYVPHIALGTHCYVISRSGAAKMCGMLAKGLDSKFHIDFMINAKHRDLNIYAFHPKLAAQQCILSTSSIATGKHPSAVNMILDKVVDADGTSWAYKMTCPAFALGPYIVNMWTFIFVVLGLASGKISGRYRHVLIAAVYLVFFAPDIAYSNVASMNTIGNMALFHFASRMV